MCDSLSTFAVHLLQNRFRFVLFGHIQTDELEHRFGRFRQMSGSNYYISVKQLLQSEKTIKIASSLKHTQLSPMDLSSVGVNDGQIAETTVTTPFPLFHFDDIHIDLERSELQLLCFVGGYIAVSVSRKLACQSCASVLMANDSLPTVETVQPSEFFDIVNRGGLKKPSDTLFILCSHAYSIFAHLKGSLSFPQFITHENPLSLFCSIVINVLNSSPVSDILALKCPSHDLVHHVLRTLFNIMCKNFVRNFKTRLASSDALKIAKLRSSKAS
jgi:hypothetical protein